MILLKILNPFSKELLYVLLIGTFLALSLFGSALVQRKCLSCQEDLLLQQAFTKYSILGNITGNYQRIFKPSQKKLLVANMYSPPPWELPGVIPMAVFNDSLRLTLRWEGGYVNNPNDPGGETNFGISKRQFPYLDIKNLTKSKAGEIYYNKYWLKFRIGEIQNQDVANLVFDMVVNHGRGIKIVQQTLNQMGQRVSVDNRMGSKTIEAINKANSFTLLNKLVANRVKYYNSLIANNPKNAEFRKGWHLRAYSFMVSTPVKLGGMLVLGGLIYWFFLKR